MRMLIDPRAQRWLRRIPPRRLYTLAELALMAVLAWQVARLIWAIVAPVGPVGDWRPAVPGAQAQLGAGAAGFDPFFRLSAGGPAGGAVTDLSLTLHGVRADQASGRGSAIIGLPDGSQASYAVGEEIMPGVTLAAVAFDNVTIKRGGRDEMLYMDQSLPAATVAPPISAAASAPAEIAQPMAMPVPAPMAPNGGLAGDTQISPRIIDGRINGLILQPRGSGQAFTAAGLQPGDVLVSINGTRVAGQGDAERVAAQLGGRGTAAIEVERGGRVIALQAKLSQ